MQNKRILIACPTLGLDPNPDQWLRGLLSIINQVRRAGMDYGFLAPYRMTWWPANNMIFDAAFENKFDYILRMDDDVHQIPDNALEKLLEADKPVVGAAYPSQRFPFMIVAVNRTIPDSLLDISRNNKMVLRSATQEEGADVAAVDQVGFGLTLIRVKDFMYMPRPMFQGPEDVADDTYFAQLCLDNNIQQYVHFGVQLAHRHVTFSNNGYLYNSVVLAPQVEPPKKEAAVTEEKKEDTNA